MDKTLTRDAERAARVKKTARIVGCSTDLVYAVLNADRNNETVISTYMNLQEGEAELENKLLAAVKTFVSFN